MEEQTAEAVGLPATVLSELEEGLLPDGLEEEVYVRVRNHIVTKWREDVTRWLSEEEAGSCLAAALQPVARFAWRMLLTHGAINVGVAPDILRRGTAAPDTQGSVIVIGAGLAGLAAARQLRMLGYKVVVLEGRDRAGGRVYSKALRWQPPGPDSGERSAEEEVVAMADLGGSVITGIDGNPLALLARQLQLPLHNIRQECPLYEAASGKPVDDDLDKEAQIAFNAALDRCSRLKDQLSQKAADSLSLGVALRTVVAAARDTADGNGGTGGGEGGNEEMMDALIEWHIANLEFANAAEVCSVSLSQWDQDDPWEHKGPHVFIPGGNGQLVQALTWGLPIFYNTVVRSIQYHADGVRVLTDDTCFSADAALVTVPLGVLKRRVLDFQPPLPQRKQAAIERLGFGLLNKVVLLFPYTFWDSQADMFGRVVPAPGLRGECFLFYSYTLLSGGALLIALISGEAAEEFEKLSAGDAVERAVAALKAVFAPAGVTVPPPLQAVCTKWGSDPMAFGAYSSVAVGSQGEDYSILAESVMDRLFFAGEATTAQYPATMHGAFHSGLREAAKISLALARPRRERARALEEAGRKREPLRASAADLEAVERLLLVSRLLTKAFGSQDHLPDLAFGCISALLPPEELVAPGGALARLALVRIGIGSIKAGPRLPLDALYTVLPIEQLRTLMDVEGGDVARITFLVNDLNCRLLGRNALCSQTSQLLRLILMGRGEPVPEALEVIAASGDGKDEQEAAVEDSSWMSGTGTACGRVVAE